MEKTALKPIDYFGCIFAPKSPRCVSVPLAKEITKVAHSVGKQTVGVFVDAPLEQIVDTVNLTEIDVVQLHGAESEVFCETLKPLGIRVWKAFPVWDKLPMIEDYLPYVEFPLLDTKGTAEGGNGFAFDWQLLKGLPSYSFILAGGVSEENVQEALHYKPAIIDVNSKVEQGNRKSRQLIEKLIEKIHKHNK